ncbi:peptidoglycan endopeptidase [Sphingomonas sp. CFBP 13728]|uniref:peptidoglycan endopeptidase n=1 Tax=Sphingomonas sp. CFBP 13728 TaxID=2775294 RepID=UPI0017801E9C|nr:peptidoglycan endopeptidase [Sphingomonas sp. CFBP 13728]MBD8618898.1 peptidoglycan endopeptidase [Sphingomonas sp. CFBP 13728]
MSAVAAAAVAAVGTRFRLHGRGADGLDCVGLVALALRAGGYLGEVPRGYALRGNDWGLLDRVLVRVAEAEAGDVLLMAAGPGQLHLGIRTAAGFVHADAGLRRVVERPGMPPWPVLGVWRMGV